ncbi:MAG: tRNA pseudouridine(38-40) synthase TruA [Bacteroidales bacterium]|nr:tRNA pseudouridine(38-40) synthase TruA [Bacteroidales bacterium]
MRFFIELQYNGKNYCGWQRQPNGITVQEVLENALNVLFNPNNSAAKLQLYGCGRTDTGVHAKQFFAHFDIVEQNKSSFLCMPEMQSGVPILREKSHSEEVAKLNSFLPSDIAIKRIFPVSDDMHARFSAKSRKYEYRISTQKNPFNSDFAFQIHYPLDIEKMSLACEIVKEYRDFSAFSKSHSDTVTNNCTIFEAFWTKNDEEIQFTIQANRFLRNMVRAIVGTMLNVGRGKVTMNDFHQIIENKNRSNAGMSVPAHALSLVEVLY